MDFNGFSSMEKSTLFQNSPSTQEVPEEKQQMSNESLNFSGDYHPLQQNHQSELLQYLQSQNINFNSSSHQENINQIQQLLQDNQTQWNPPPVQEITSKSKIKKVMHGKACTSCRKVHTACDNGRPCRRCILYNLECIDPPKKIRQTKSKSGTTKPSSSHKSTPYTQSHQSPQQQSILDKGDQIFSELLTEKNVAEFFSDTSLNFRPNNAFDYQPNNLTISSPNNSQLQVYDPHIDSMNRMTDALTVLAQQMVDLKHSNKSLEVKINQVTEELEQMKAANNQIISRKDWFAFKSQESDLSIAVWRPTFINDTKQLILIECNTRFKELVGYSEEVLANNFNANTLLNWQMEVCPNFRSSVLQAADIDDCDDKFLNFVPLNLRTKINVASGMKDVQISIHPIKDSINGKTLKYFLMHVLEVA